MPFIAIVCLWLLSAPINAEQLTSANAHWPPWRTVEADGSLTGIEVDILERLSVRLDLPLITKGCGWKRCLKHMEVGESDVMMGLFKTPEREKYMTFVSPPYRAEKSICFYQNKNQTAEIKNYEDLHKITVGVVNKVAYFDQFDRDEAINKYNATTDEPLFRLLKAERLDAVIMACVTGNFFLKNSEFYNDFKHAEYVYRVDHPVYLAISNQSSILVREDEISQALQGMIKDGEIKQIMSSYGVLDLE